MKINRNIQAANVIFYSFFLSSYDNKNQFISKI